MAKRRANGEGNIRKRKDGRWEGRYTAGYDQDGKRIIRTVLGRTQAEVKSKLSVAIAESQQLDVSRSGEYTVAEWLRLWFELYAKPSIRPSTAGYYRRAMEEYTMPRIGTAKLNKLTRWEIQKLYKDLLENGRLRKKQRKKHPGLSGSTVRGVHIMLHSALDRAVKERLLIRNPADRCVVPKAQHQEMKTLQPEDLKAYLDAAERQNALAMFYLELVSGIRKGELVALRWKDLNVEQRTISVSKQATKDENNNLVVTRPKAKGTAISPISKSIIPEYIFAPSSTYFPAGSWGIVYSIPPAPVLSRPPSGKLKQSATIPQSRPSTATETANNISDTFSKLLQNYHVKQSFSASGCPYDNAAAETFFATFKKEEEYRREYTSEQHFQKCAEEHIRFYNEVRPHQTLDYKTPQAFEAAHEGHYIEKLSLYSDFD